MQNLRRKMDELTRDQHECASASRSRRRDGSPANCDQGDEREEDPFDCATIPPRWLVSSFSFWFVVTRFETETDWGATSYEDWTCEELLQ
jgi:hypothetical protein